MNKLNRWISLLLVLTLGCLLGMLGFSLLDKPPTPIEPVVWSKEAEWITSQEATYRFYARHTFYVPDTIQAGWLRLSADNDFTLYVNGRQVAQKRRIYDNSSSFASRFSEPSQDFNQGFNYQIRSNGNLLQSNPRDWKFSFYVDLTRYLRSGKNTIALEVEKEQTNPRAVVEGAVYTIANSTPIKLNTGATSWRVSNLFENRQALLWFDSDFTDQSWSEAKSLGAVKEFTYSRLRKNLFDRPVQGNWITGSKSSQGEVWLRGVWRTPPTQISRAYIRFAGKGTYSLLLNGTLINHYGIEDGNQLHLYEVTELLKTGENVLAVRLANPLDTGTNTNSLNPDGSADFLLDGWTETEKGEVVGVIATDENWTDIRQPVPGWSEGAGKGEAVSFVGLPKMQQFQRIFEGNAYLLNYPNYLWHQCLWQLGGIGFALAYTLILGLLLRKGSSWWDSLNTGAAILSPGTLFLISIGLLKHRYAEAERGLLFTQAHSNYVILAGFTSIVILTFILALTNSKLAKFTLWCLWFLLGIVAATGMGLTAGGNLIHILLLYCGISVLTMFWALGFPQHRISYSLLIKQTWQSHSEWFLLIVIVAIGFGLRLYNLDFADLDWDENVSLDATRGILRIGAPEATAGTWYTRSPAYHYMLAFWLHLIGDSVYNARLLSVIWGSATLVLIYLFTREISGKAWIALLVTAIFTIDPFILFYSRNIRFYQVVQFMTIAVFWSFCKGFIDTANRRYQFIFFISLILLLLNQELNITLIPAFIIGFLFFYRPFSLLKDWSILLGGLLTFVIYAYNAIFFSIKTLTPIVALSTRTESLIKLHFFDFTAFLNIFFVGYSRSYTIYSFFFFAGIVYFLNQRNTKILFMYIGVLSNILMLTLLSSAINPRYTYGIYSLFLILSIYSAITITENLAQKVYYNLSDILPGKNIAIICLLILIASNIEPIRVISGYQAAINPQNSKLLEYIRQNRQSGDIIISNSPPSAAVNIGKINYHISQTKTVEFGNLYLKDGNLIDRTAGSKAITNYDQISNILSQAKRIWIHVDLGRKSLSNPDIANAIQTVGKTVKESFGTRLRLWQQEDGLIFRQSNEGKDLGSY